MNIILITALFALALAFALGFALGFFRKFFAVPQDPLVGMIREALPGANCGACGYPGCDGYAQALAEGTASGATEGTVSGTTDCGRCTVGGPAVAEKLAALTGGTSSAESWVAVLACGGSRDKAPLKGEYTGLKTCRGAKLSSGGTKLCAWGCMGFGDCVKVCQFGALALGEEGLPVVDHALCTGCKICVAECPQGLIRAMPRKQAGAFAFCSNRSPQRALVIKTCKAGCIKCELCVKNCPEGCITMDKGLPVVDYGKCTSCGTCVAKCPTKVFRLREDLHP